MSLPTKKLLQKGENHIRTLKIFRNRSVVLKYVLILMVCSSSILLLSCSYTSNKENSRGDSIRIEEKILSSLHQEISVQEKVERITMELHHIDWAIYEEVSENKSIKLLEFISTNIESSFGGRIIKSINGNKESRWCACRELFCNSRRTVYS